MLSYYVLRAPLVCCSLPGNPVTLSLEVRVPFFSPAGWASRV